MWSAELYRILFFISAEMSFSRIVLLRMLTAPTGKVLELDFPNTFNKNFIKYDNFVIALKNYSKRFSFMSRNRFILIHSSIIHYSLIYSSIHSSIIHGYHTLQLKTLLTLCAHPLLWLFHPKILIFFQPYT